MNLPNELQDFYHGHLKLMNLLYSHFFVDLHRVKLESWSHANTDSVMHTLLYNFQQVLYNLYTILWEAFLKKEYIHNRRRNNL